MSPVDQDVLFSWLVFCFQDVLTQPRRIPGLWYRRRVGLGFCRFASCIACISRDYTSLMWMNRRSVHPQKCVHSWRRRKLHWSCAMSLPTICRTTVLSHSTMSAASPTNSQLWRITRTSSTLTSLSLLKHGSQPDSLPVHSSCILEDAELKTPTCNPTLELVTGVFFKEKKTKTEKLPKSHNCSSTLR